MISSKRRKELIEKRFLPIFNRVLSWSDPKYSDLDLFKSIITEINNDKNRMYDHIGSAILEEELPSLNEYWLIKSDISDNLTEYKYYLIELAGKLIHSKHKRFIKLWNEKDKYLILAE